MHGNEVVDLQRFRDAETERQDQNDTGSHYLPNGTTLLLGQYVIDGYLNCGGFGITYTAHDSLGRKVVIKECFPAEMVYRRGKDMAPRSPKYRDDLTDIVRNFVVEAHSLANAKHPNIVHVHQIFEENGTAYMAMDYIEGSDLLDIVESDEKLTPKQVQALTRKMLEAIRYVHSMGMLHRDISPDNILVARSGEPVLIDFGAAHRHAQQAATGPARMKFVKDGYSPQEFYVAGSAQGTFSDLYSFAASIYHVISGAAPIDAQSRMSAIGAKRNDPYEPLAGRIKGYPARFLTAIDKALSVAPEDRIQTADAWLAHVPPIRSSAAARVFAPATAVLESLSVFDDARAMTPSRTAAHSKTLLAAGAAGLAILIGTGLVLTHTDGAEVTAEAQTATATAAPVEATPPNLARMAALAPPAPLISVWPEGFSSGLADSLPETRVPLGEQAHPAPQALATPAKRAAPVIALPAIAGASGAFDAPDIRDADAAMAGAFAGDVSPRAQSSGTDRLAAFATPRPPGKPGLDATHTPGRNQLGSVPLDLALTTIAPVALSEPLAALPSPPLAGRVSIDTMAPAYAVRTPQADIPASYSRWELALPFTVEPGPAGEIQAAVIERVLPGADLSGVGDWIAEGVTIVAVNETPLEKGVSLTEQVLNTGQIGPDGRVRASIWYRKPFEQVLDQAILAVPVTRMTGLADGTVLETRKRGESWVTSVAVLGSAVTDLRPGDLIVGNARAQTRFTDHRSVEAALNALAQSGATAAQFAVLRNGQRLRANWRLADR